MKLVVLALACCAVLAQDERPASPFGGLPEIMSHLLQNVEMPRGNPDLQQAVVTPNQGFDIEIEIKDGEAPIVHHRLGGKGQHGGKGIFGQMMQRMQRMRQQMGNMFGGKGQLTRKETNPFRDHPMHEFLRHQVKKKMKRAHKKLQRQCSEEMAECTDKHGPGLIDCLIAKRRSLSEDCSEQLHQMKKLHAKNMKKVYGKHKRLLERVRQECRQDLDILCPPPFQVMGTAQQQPQARHPLICLMKNVNKLSADSQCQRLVQRTANKWGRFEMWQARKSQLSRKLKTVCLDETKLCQVRLKCPFKVLGCLGKHKAQLSTECRDTVVAEQAKHLAEKQQKKVVHKAHKRCKKAFKSALETCGHDSEDETDDELDDANINDKGSCISKARVVSDECHQKVEQMMASHIKPVEQTMVTQKPSKPSLQLTPAPEQSETMYRHKIITSPGDHCLEVVIPGGEDSPFWKALSWKYGPPDKPEWVAGACDKTKWKYFNSKTDNFDTYSAAKNSPYGEVVENKYGLVASSSMPWLRVNPILAAESAQASEEKPAPETPRFKQHIARVEARAATKAETYSISQDDKTLIVVLAGLLSLLLVAGLYMVTRKRQHQGDALKEMHMVVVESEDANMKTSHDQL